MFKKIFIPILGGIGIGSLYLHKQKIEINNYNLRNVLKILHSQNPNLPKYLMKGLIRFKMIKKSDLLQKYVLSYGIDNDGKNLQSLMQLGFNSVQIGPVSLMPSGLEDKRRHCGSKIALANVNTFWENDKKNNSKNSNSNIGVCIEPNYQIFKYTPYLIAENIIQCMKQFQGINQIFDNQAVKYYIFKLNDPLIKQLNSKQYLTMISELIIYSKQILQQTEKSFQQKQNPKISKQNKIKIYLQIPSQMQNPQLFNMVKSLPQTTHLLIDGQQLQVIHNKKNTIDTTFSLGRKKLTFDDLVNWITNNFL